MYPEDALKAGEGEIFNRFEVPQGESSTNVDETDRNASIVSFSTNRK